MTDLTGRRFGRLTVCSLADPYVSPKGCRIRQWNCVCDCGQKMVVRSNFLTSGKVTSCGCERKRFPDLPRVDPSRPSSESDLTGMRFGRLTVLGLDEPYVSPRGTRERRWKCACDCGNVTTVRAGALASGNTRSCGCLRGAGKVRDPDSAPAPYTPNFKCGADLTGMRFGRLTVLGLAEPYVTPKGLRVRRWECLCDCGNIACVRSHFLTSGETKSCGCLRHDRPSAADLLPDKNSR